MVTSTDTDPIQPTETQKPPIGLSKRQMECLRGVAEHLDSQQIAARLGISPHTVDGHIAAAVKAVGARSRRDAVKFLRVDPVTSQSITGEFPPVVDQPSSNPPPPAAVQEASEPFIGFDAPPRAKEGQQHAPVIHPLMLLALIVVIAVGLAMLVLASDPMAQSAARLANLIQPYH